MTNIPKLLRRLKLKLSLDTVNSSMVKQISERLNQLSAQIEQEMENSKLIPIEEPIRKTASYKEALKSLERKMDIVDEASLMKLSTADQSSNLPKTIETLKLAYDNAGDSSISKIKILNVEPTDFGASLIKVTDGHGADLSFFLFPYGNRMKMVPENPQNLALWESIVSNAGNIANVLNMWSCGTRENNSAQAIGVTEPEVRMYNGPGIAKSAAERTYVGSPMLQNINKQQADFIEVSASDVIPQDPKWLKHASSKELQQALKKVSTIRNSLGKNQFTETKKWAIKWQERIKTALEKRKNKDALKKLAYKKMQELKRIMQKLKS